MIMMENSLDETVVEWRVFLDDTYSYVRMDEARVVKKIW